MAKAKSSNPQQRTKNGLIVKPIIDSIVRTSRKTNWIVTDRAAQTVDQLSFTSRDSVGRINWWDVKPPKTDYWHAHVILGRAYAFEVLDLLNNPNAKGDNEHTLGYIMDAISRWVATPGIPGASGMAHGFFSAISEYVARGTADR